MASALLPLVAMPSFVRETPSSMSSMDTNCLPSRTLNNAASLATLASSAPVKPGVAREITSHTTSTSSSRSKPRKCTDKICALPCCVGGPTNTRRVKRPGRNSAGSSASGRFVAAKIKIPTVLGEPVHLDQQLIERLVAFFVQTRASPRSDGVQFVDEYNRRSGLSRLGKQLANARRTAADEQFDELGRGDGEKRNAGFAPPPRERAASYPSPAVRPKGTPWEVCRERSCTFPRSS